MKIRNGFVSNSSSSSFIVIKNKNVVTPLDRYNHEIFAVDCEFGETEFGWQFDKYYDFGSKVIFTYLQILYANAAQERIKKHEKLSRWDKEILNACGNCENWLEMLERVIKTNLPNVKIIEWKISSDYDADDYGYIDHQSNAGEGENTEMFESEDKLKNFLFNYNSCIHTGNDNV